MLEFALLMTVVTAVGYATGRGGLALLERTIHRRVATGRAALNPLAESAAHWLILVLVMAEIFGLGVVLAG